MWDGLAYTIDHDMSATITMAATKGNMKAIPRYQINMKI